MSDKQPTPVSGGDEHQGKPDGVNIDAPSGRTGGSESDGGAYQNPHTGKDGDSDAGGFMGHGGQTDIGYHGAGQAGREHVDDQNATTAGDADEPGGGGSAGAKPGPTGPDDGTLAEQTRATTMGGRTVEISETSGTAVAEASGMTGAAGQHKADGEAPGSG